MTREKSQKAFNEKIGLSDTRRAYCWEFEHNFKISLRVSQDLCHASQKTDTIKTSTKVSISKF